MDAAATGVVHSKSPIMSVTITLTNPRDGANEKLVANPQSPITVWQFLVSTVNSALTLVYSPGKL